MGTFHQRKFTDCMFDYFSMIKSREIKERYSLILVCIPTKFGGCTPSDQVITHVTCRNGSFSGLDGKGVRLHSHDTAHAIVVCHAELFLIYSFSTLLTSVFLISLAKLLYLTFYLLFLVHIVTFSFSCSCQLLNTPTHS